MKHAFENINCLSIHPFPVFFNRRRISTYPYSLNQKGLTLIEMLVVMGLIGIICAIAVPNIPVMLRSYRLRAAANELASTLQFARLTAISQNANSVLAFDMANQTYSVFSDNGEGGGTLNDGVQTGSEPTLKTVSIRNGYNREVSLQTPSFGLTTTFNSQGICTLSGTMTLQNSVGSTAQIVLSSGGSIKILYP